MPRSCSSAPRKKLPPPTTTATCKPRRTTVAICRARPCTTSGSTPILPPPKASPDNLSTTRRARTDPSNATPFGAECVFSPVPSTVVVPLTIVLATVLLPHLPPPGVVPTSPNPPGRGRSRYLFTPLGHPAAPRGRANPVDLCWFGLVR